MSICLTIFGAFINRRLYMKGKLIILEASGKGIFFFLYSLHLVPRGMLVIWISRVLHRVVMHSDVSWRYPDNWIPLVDISPCTDEREPRRQVEVDSSVVLWFASFKSKVELYVRLKHLPLWDIASENNPRVWCSTLKFC